MSEPVVSDAEPAGLPAADEREVWDVPVPPGGWGTPWPQCVELARALPSTQWTLVGGLMVQLHSAAAGLAVSRPTADVDILLIETGAATTTSVAAVLRSLGYELEPSIDDATPAHRFARGKEQIDVMVSDHLAPKMVPTLGGRRPFQVAGGTQALQRTVNCRMTADDDGPVLISIPNALGALVLKGAAYREDSRDKNRHLDDAVVLSATVKTPLATAREMKGSDRSRVLSLHKELTDPGHRSWQLLEPADRTPAMDVLRILAANPNIAPVNRLKRG